MGALLLLALTLFMTLCFPVIVIDVYARAALCSKRTKAITDA